MYVAEGLNYGSPNLAQPNADFFYTFPEANNVWQQLRNDIVQNNWEGSLCAQILVRNYSLHFVAISF